MSIVIVSSGLGNVGSIKNMIQRISRGIAIANGPESLAYASKIIIPGVGAYDRGMAMLSEKGFIQPIREAADKGVPILGICLGMQLMVNGSEEGKKQGLGLVPGNVKRFPSGDGLPRVPHMGWGRVKSHKSSTLFSEIEENRRYYFAHSYYVSCDDQRDILATTEYGVNFVSAYQRKNIFGVQFHPEKSHRYGMALLDRFLQI
jgi:imidazole glycerol-phosphate synthase subunit HisH